ncbi:MAG TPA: hypothetical protein VML19_11180 [Verrucomicrobiae bacterium]|nr:hypothetical protein [Verrucomicrobiae bacterium]
MGLKVRFLGSGCVALVICTGGGGQTVSSVSYIYNRTPCYDRETVGKGVERFPDGASLRLVTNGVKRELAPNFAASADAAVSFDGRCVLFSGKQKPADPWQIWEVAVSGGAPRKITAFREDAIAPFYVSDQRIVYARRTPAGFQLETAWIDGKDPNRLTYSPGDHVPTAVLRDGRVLFDAPHPGGRGRDVYAVYVDGSGVESYRCDHGRDRHSGVEVSSGDIVFESGGRLARFTSARAVQMELAPVQGEFAGPIAEVASGDWLVAYRTVEGQPFGIYRWRPGQGTPERICREDALQAVEPVLIRPHAIPKRHPSALGNREGVNLLCLNAYTSRLRVPSGAVASVRVWALDNAGAPVSLGEAPVEQDGSFFVTTPSERAIRFELLDHAHKTVAAEKGWFWGRRGEQRVCVGCHAGPEHAPDNAAPATLLRSIEPAKMMLPVRGAK